MHAARAFPWFLLVLLLGATGSVRATDALDCQVARFDRYADAQARWQRDLTALIAARHPALARVATLYRDDQLVRIALRRRVIRHLAEGRPVFLDPHQPLHRWGLLDRDGEARLAADDPELADLLARRRAARDRPPHADGDALRRVMRESLMHDPAYLELLGALTTALDAAEAARCD